MNLTPEILWVYTAMHGFKKNCELAKESFIYLI